MAQSDAAAPRKKTDVAAKMNGKAAGRKKVKAAASRLVSYTVTNVQLTNRHWEQAGPIAYEYVATVIADVTAPTDPPGAQWTLHSVKAKLRKNTGTWVTAVELAPMTCTGGNTYEATLRGPESAIPQNTTVDGYVVAEWSCAAFAQSADSNNYSSGTHP